MSHYETLGVPRDATDEQIRDAARKASSKAHPDREGGSDEAMAAINAARDVLLDTERRAQYDATGSDKQAASRDDKARAVLVASFEAAVDAPIHMNIVEEIEGRLGDGIDKGLDEIGRNEGAIERLERRRARIAFKGAGENLAHGIIDSKLERLRKRNDGLADSIKTLERAIELLEEYEHVPEQPAQPKVPSTFSQQFLGLSRAPFGGFGA